jgi:Mlc titration factor MtfA (ptsG expression regulator)
MILRRWRRERAMRKPFPDDWLEILTRNLPYYNCLPHDKQAQLKALVQAFLVEKWFEGAAGLTITDEIRVTIAAQACVLLLGREEDIYPGLRTIIVYPHTYQAHETVHRPEGTQIERAQIRTGESWSYGTIVLSWDNVLHGTLDMHDGENVVLHEFAHQLDDEMGPGDGVPDLPNITRYKAWAKVFAQEYALLLDRLRRQRSDIFRAYAAESPAEFFAVATELFFERPRQLRSQHRELYAQLQLFYQQDPAEIRECE